MSSIVWNDEHWCMFEQLDLLIAAASTLLTIIHSLSVATEMSATRRSISLFFPCPTLFSTVAFLSDV